MKPRHLSFLLLLVAFAPLCVAAEKAAKAPLAVTPEVQTAEWARQDVLHEFSAQAFEAGFGEDVPPGSNPVRVPGLVPFVQVRHDVVQAFLEDD